MTDPRTHAHAILKHPRGVGALSKWDWLRVIGLSLLSIADSLAAREEGRR